MADEAELSAKRACFAVECKYKVQNGVKEIYHILKALHKHILAAHGSPQKPSSGGAGAKLTATW